MNGADAKSGLVRLQWAVTGRLAIRSLYHLGSAFEEFVQFHERFETDPCAIGDSCMRSGRSSGDSAFLGHLLVVRGLTHIVESK
ncbi:hypothetical protein [Nitrospira sp. BLG_2]|uniref:hypothetical protein n=1 Tax=Nitrospira sp. BLG_2 TaxID=3397507 RepID=UPI003B9A1FED